MARASDARPFANGFEGESWMANWCSSCRHSDDEDGCVLIGVAVLGKTPYAWEPVNWRSLAHRYACHEYLRRPAQDCCDQEIPHWHTTRPCGCKFILVENASTVYETEHICEPHQL